MKIEITQTVDIEVPEVPKHLKTAGAKKASTPISELPEDALRTIGQEWTNNLLLAAGYSIEAPITEEEFRDAATAG